MRKEENIKQIVKKNYSKIASDKKSGCSCGCFNAKQISKSIGYTDLEINNVPEANLGLGCGNPTALSTIKQGVERDLMYF